MPDDLRAVLEGIVFGDDARITPGDRLRAAAELRELPHESPPLPIDLAELSNAALDDELDGLLADTIIEAAMSGEGWPQLGALIRQQVERRAAQLADADRIEAEINAKAEARAAQLYLDAGWRSLRLTLDSATETAAEGSQAVETAHEQSHELEPPGVPAVAFPDELPQRKRRARRRRFT